MKDTRTPRYVARDMRSGRFTFHAIYDQERRSYPTLLGGKAIPQSFPSLDEAQAWADEHLNRSVS